MTIVTYAVTRAERQELRISDEHRRFDWFALDMIDALPLPGGYRRSIRAAAADPGWLALGRELQAMAQTGLHYTKDKFDADRYARLRVLASQMMAMGTGGHPNTSPSCSAQRPATRHRASPSAAPPFATTAS